MSLRELAARTDPPVTKAAMAGRLARLVALARDGVEAPEATG
jgi:DNA-binding transcriptional regulator WhiA